MVVSTHTCGKCMYIWNSPLAEFEITWILHFGKSGQSLGLIDRIASNSVNGHHSWATLVPGTDTLVMACAAICSSFSKHYLDCHCCYTAITGDKRTIPHIHSDRRGVGVRITCWSPRSDSLWAWGELWSICCTDFITLGRRTWKLQTCVSWRTTPFSGFIQLQSGQPSWLMCGTQLTSWMLDNPYLRLSGQMILVQHLTHYRLTGQSLLYRLQTRWLVSIMTFIVPIADQLAGIYYNIYCTYCRPSGQNILLWVLKW